MLPAVVLFLAPLSSLAPAGAATVYSAVELQGTHTPSGSDDKGGFHSSYAADAKRESFAEYRRGEFAEARFTIGDIAYVQAQAPVNDEGGGKLSGTTARSDIWGGYVLQFSVPGATPDQVTRIKLKVKISGSITDPGPGGSGELGLSLCIGLRNKHASCSRMLPQWVSDLLLLPRARGVQEGASDVQVFDGGPQFVSWRENVVVKIVGKRATVPFWYLLSAAAGTSGQQQATAASNLTVRWTLYLPDGVTCSSRSGRAIRRDCASTAAPAAD